MVCGDHRSFSSILFQPATFSKTRPTRHQHLWARSCPFASFVYLWSAHHTSMRYSKQDQADHGRSRWSNLGNEFRHFLLHPNPRQCIWESRQAPGYTAGPKLARALSFLIIQIDREKVMNFWWHLSTFFISNAPLQKVGAWRLYDVVCHSAPTICSYENGLTSSERVSSKVRWCSCSLSDACGFCDSESSVTTKIFETGLKPLFLPPKFFTLAMPDQTTNLDPNNMYKVFAARGQGTCDCLDFLGSK